MVSATCLTLDNEIITIRRSLVELVVCKAEEELGIIEDDCQTVDILQLRPLARTKFTETKFDF